MFWLRLQWDDKWETLLWHMVCCCKFWLGVPTPSPDAVQINCGGREEAPWTGPLPPFHCAQKRVSGNCVYGPALSPADQAGEKTVGIAAGHTTSLHELAMLLSLTADPSERWKNWGSAERLSCTLGRRLPVRCAPIASASQASPHVLSQWLTVETPCTSSVYG